MNRSVRRQVRAMLKHSHCAACGGQVDETAHHAVLHEGVVVIEHLLCGTCFNQTASSEEAAQAIALRCRESINRARGARLN